MPYKISGTVNQNAKIIVVDEASWEIDHTEDVSAGSYEVEFTANNPDNKLVLAMRTNGELLGYGKVDPIATADTDNLLLMHMDESPFTDSSPVGHTILQPTPFSRVTNQYKFGGYSAYAGDGTSGAAYMRTQDTIAFTTGDWTIDGWFMSKGRPTDWGHKGLVSGQSAASSYWEIRWQTDGEIRVFFVSSTVSKLDITTNTTAMWSDDTWFHLAVVRSGMTIYMFVDGVSQTYNTSTALQNDLGCTLQVNVGNNYNCNNALWGWMDEVRISKVARWTTNFTPPTTPYL